MTQKQTPYTFTVPISSTGILHEIGIKLIDAFKKVRNDLDNGATTFPIKEIAGIANVALSDFDEGQIRFYVDTSDSNKTYLVTRIQSALKKEELT
jgi:hypothetical protein